MDDLGIIDQFVSTFSSYIESGFGLLGGEVQYLTGVLIGIDITLAGLYWAMGSDTSVIGKFLNFCAFNNHFQQLWGFGIRGNGHQLDSG